MRLPASAHAERRWRIHEITADFRVEDVWALPTPGGPDDFPRLVQQATTDGPEALDAQGRYVGDGSGGILSRASRALFELRWKIGELLGLDGDDDGLDARVPTLRDRLPEDLRDGAAGPAFPGLPFEPLYLTGDEFAAEIANRTMHGVLHLGWVEDGHGGHCGQMTVLVKRNGLLGAAYMAAIAPFRHFVVYPPMLRDMGRRWERAA